MDVVGASAEISRPSSFRPVASVSDESTRLRRDPPRPQSLDARTQKMQNAPGRTLRPSARRGLPRKPGRGFDHAVNRVLTGNTPGLKPEKPDPSGLRTTQQVIPPRRLLRAEH